uniref:Band 3 cytoplasmic domain-containing protein n=1 Tax=Trichuris muris TaxID=70415 RepID=A0A5S6Q915_TRIMR
MHSDYNQGNHPRRCSSSEVLASVGSRTEQGQDKGALSTMASKQHLSDGLAAMASSSSVLYESRPKHPLQQFQCASSFALNTHSLRRSRAATHHRDMVAGEPMQDCQHRVNGVNRHESGQRYLAVTNSTASRSSIDLFDEDSVNEFDECDEEVCDNVTLMYAKHEKIPMKDFGSEVRATMDIDHLLNKAVLLLDLPETSLEEIFNKIIHEMDIQEPEFTSEQVKKALFTENAGNQFHILTRTVQSICTTNIAGTHDFDQTWICAICVLPTVQHRHVAIARLTHPTNLGRTMQDLRFIIIVIAPSRAKGTKTALETARTFATLFADLDIRQRLVMAPSVEYFRQTMLFAAKELAVEQNQSRDRKLSLHLSNAKQQLVWAVLKIGI